VDWDFSPFQNSCARILNADRHPSIEAAHLPSPDVITEQGVNALLCRNLDALTQKADELETANSPDEALVSWFSKWVAFAQGFRGVVTLMAAAHTNPDSALYASCAAVHSASARILLRAQAE
jgi:hypothetical protein